MKNIVLKVLSFVVCAATVVTLAGCGSKTEPIDASQLIGTSKLANGEGYENSKYKMEWNATSKCVVFTDKENGTQWSTTPSDFLNSAEKPARMRNYLESPLIVEYYSVELGEPDTVRGYTHCIKDNNFSATKKDNTITVDYYFDDINTIIPIDYTLADDHFSISVDMDRVVESDNHIYSIKLAPYFCSVKTGTEDSYLFYPSGTGTLIDTADPTLLSYEYSTDVYGPDAARKIKEKLTNDKNIYLPVFGAKNGNKAIMGVVSSGAEQASLILTTGDSITGYSRIATEFYVRGYDYNTIKGNLTYDETSIYAENGVKGTVFTVDFYDLYDDEADYVGMAKKYQQVLYGDNKATDIKEDAYSLKIAGGLMQEKNFIGYPYTKLKALTTYADVSKMLDELSVTGVKPNVQMYGFGATGLDVGQVAGGFKLGSAFGSKKEIASLMQYCTENGIDAFMDFNMTTFSKAGNGYFGMFDTAQTANKQAAYQYYISKTVQTQDSKVYDRFRLLARDGVIKAGQKLIKRIDKYSLTGVSFASLSDTAYSDYQSDKYYMKKDFGKMVQEIVAPYKEKGYNFAANGANLYAATVADCIFETPLNSSEYDVFTVTVPFYQIVFKGKVEITSEAVNVGEALQKKELQALETGSSMLFTVYNTYCSELTFSPHKNLYGGVFESNKQNIIDVATKYKDYYDAISGQTIANHEILADNVRLTTFSNGVKIYVNYSNSDYTGEAGTVKAMDCLIVK